MFDYYCVDCGRKFHADEIHFDLADFLGLRNHNYGECNRASHISAEELKKLAERSGEPLKHGQRSRIEITLKEFLEKMGENVGGQLLKNLMGYYEYNEFKEAIDRVFSVQEIHEVAARLAEEYTTAIQNKFTFILDKEGDSEKDNGRDERQDLGNYHAYFWIEPEFFENGTSDALYTVKYSPEDTMNMRKLMSPAEIRGYCPSCGNPVLMGAGKYRHILIGLLGVQCSGKTSIILAMLAEMRRSFHTLDVVWPGNALCDSQFGYREINMRRYEHGRAVYETSKYGFNTSFLLEARKGDTAQIYTFADTAGEQCYDLDEMDTNPAIFQTCPLLESCDIYLLCTAIDQDVMELIPPDAAIQIVKRIYSNLRNRQNIPPLCVLITKADNITADAVSGGTESLSNPFKSIRMSEEYLYKAHICQIKDAYDAAENLYTQKILKWCKYLYQELRNTTYLSMMLCSAQGRLAETREDDSRAIPWSEENWIRKPFERKNIIDIWDWILRVTGLLPVYDGYYFPEIPSFSEDLSFGEEDCSRENNGLGRILKKRKKDCEINPSLKKARAIKSMFLNSSKED